jgi:hypothetical protein
MPAQGGRVMKAALHYGLFVVDPYKVHPTRQ